MVQKVVKEVAFMLKQDINSSSVSGSPINKGVHDMPVTAEVAGSSPVRTASLVWLRESEKLCKYQICRAFCFLELFIFFNFLKKAI